jgi:isoleucyl-tRNA synthetase
MTIISFSFHNFDFAPGKNFVQKKSHRLLLREAVQRADGQKCERCWHWETDVGSHPEHPTICARCVKAVQEGLRT